jgi:hypothetical protein
MHKLCLWHTTTEAVLWHFDREPNLDEVIPVAGFGVFRVVSKHPPSDPSVDADYVVEYVRDLSEEEERGRHFSSPGSRPLLDSQSSYAGQEAGQAAMY